MKQLVVFLMIFASVIASKTQGIEVSEELKSNATILDVKGKQGWQFNQFISFGGFHTSKIKRSWSARINIFSRTFQGCQGKT